MVLLLSAQAGRTLAFLPLMWASMEQALLICCEGEERCLSSPLRTDLLCTLETSLPGAAVVEGGDSVFFSVAVTKNT